MGNVYIAEIQKILPKKYCAKYVADKLYPSSRYGTKINKLAINLARKFNIKHRTSVVDYSCYPKIQLANSLDHPKKWGVKIIELLTKEINKSNIGMFSLNYNLSYHRDVLPNLASQIVMDAQLLNLDKNEEIPYYGCASSIYSLHQAVNYCNEYNRAAIVFTFDQCTVGCLQVDENDLYFKKMLMSNLLFTDAGVGMLLIPESMRSQYNKPVLKILDINKKYSPGDLIKMDNGNFLMSSRLKDVVPKIVSDKLIKPLLLDNQLEVNDIDEWSIHQGGVSVISQFLKQSHLNLSNKQIKPSLDLFYKNGNSSAASCVLVLDSFFNNPQSNIISGKKGMLVGFGAGYYLGALLYEWA